MIRTVFIFLALSCLPLQLAFADPLDSLPQHCHFSSQFKQTKSLVSLPVPLKSSGNIYFSCQAGLIWQTQLPIQEELVLTQRSVHFQYSQTNQLETINSLQTQFLSKLLIGLISVNKSYINETFSVETLSENQFKLTPNNNKVKKAIESINISLVSAKQELLIDILQKDQTKISIRSFSPSVFDSSTPHITQCQISTSSKLLCEALFNPIQTANTLDETSND